MYRVVYYPHCREQILSVVSRIDTARKIAAAFHRFLGVRVDVETKYTDSYGRTRFPSCDIFD